MLQLGDVQVVEKSVSAPDVSTLPTRVLRLQVYQDEWEFGWEDVVKRPIRSLVDVVPGLQLCGDASCNQRCGRYHAAVEENGVESVIVDIWGWRWVDAQGRKTSPSEAVSFSIFIRIPESGFPLLNEGCDISGIYIEPRLLQGQGTDPKFAVIWLAHHSGKQVRHLVKTDDKIVGAARLGDRFGVRVPSAHAEEIHIKLCPNKPFMQGSVTQIYRLEPLPPGIHRQGLADAVKALGWTIKPLQAARGSQGQAWEVGATGPPPQTVLKLASGYITITKLRDSQQQREERSFVASQKTKAHIRNDSKAASSSQSSPWGADGDPWAKFLQRQGQTVPQGVDPAPAAEAVKSKLDEVRASVVKEVTDRLQDDIAKLAQPRDEEMIEAAQDDVRLGRLEQDIHQLQVQGRRFEEWFAAAEDKASQQSDQLGRVEAQLEQQSEFTTRLAVTVESCTRNLGTQQELMQNLAQEVHGVKGHVETTLESFFARQMSQLEHMFGPDSNAGEARKKARNEGH